MAHATSIETYLHCNKLVPAGGEVGPFENVSHQRVFSAFNSSLVCFFLEGGGKSYFLRYCSSQFQYAPRERQQCAARPDESHLYHGLV